MGALTGTKKIFGGNPNPRRLADEFREHAQFERKEAIECIARAIREKHDVRAAVWYLANAVMPVTNGDGAETIDAFIAPERTQPPMLARNLAVVNSERRGG